ncbi:hypothetical protein DWX95_02295 [Butyricicoccus sp. AF22-28AC]|nr:hypothetical protein DWX95_02295 [Butyricicoccus sp. AF22-28AC]
MHQELLKHGDFVPLDVIQRSQPAEIFVKEAQFLMNYDWLRYRSLFALSDLCKGYDLTGIAANGVNL